MHDITTYHYHDRAYGLSIPWYHCSPIFFIAEEKLGENSAGLCSHSRISMVKVSSLTCPGQATSAATDKETTLNEDEDLEETELQ